MKKYFIVILLSCLCSFSFSESRELTQKESDDLMMEIMTLIWREAINAKLDLNNALPMIREELLENLCSSAPTTSFVTHADLSDSLTQAENTSASVFISTNNQSSWIENADVSPINQEGYENTWGATTTTDGGDNVHWYLQGSIDSGSLGLDFGQITVSQSPYNQDNSWPPESNLYATLVTDSDADTNSGQDIVGVRGTYSDNKLYASLDLQGSCCDEGSFFGPWNLYAIAIVNPDAENPVAYAYAYGNGGLGQLYPAIYKIDGDLTTGEVSGFEVLSENFSYSTSGNSFQATSLLDIIVNDLDWGEWPNSLNGVALVGITLVAALDGLDVAVTLLDTSDLGVLVMSTQNQNGNNPPILSGPTFNEDTGLLSVVYTDIDNNLATIHEVFIEDMAFVMVPGSHTYAEGVTFNAYTGSGGVAEFVFSDGDDIVNLEIDLGGGGSSCQVVGDANGDAEINVLDVVLTVNLILCSDCPDNYNECSDINSDNQINILDVVSLVNIILGVG